nr:retrovirus-related Pol polyprotein from transposon TNT 1-94 [Tanacetum cinerariifolium]
MVEEMESLKENHTYELVELPKGKKALKNKWVYRLKMGELNSLPRHKARLVVKGFNQKEGVDFGEIFSYIVKMSSIRVVLVLTASIDHEVQQLDVKTAFLHSDLEEEICMDQPEGFKVKGKENMVCKLKKSLYGLKQALRQCDILKIDKLKKELNKSFAMKDLGKAKQILGMRISRDRKAKKLWLSLEMYIEKILERFECIKQNLAHAVGVVRKHLSNPGISHWEAVKWILRYLIGTSKMCICYGYDNPVLKAFIDSNMVRDIDTRKSISGYLVTFGGGAVSW